VYLTQAHLGNSKVGQDRAGECGVKLCMGYGLLDACKNLQIIMPSLLVAQFLIPVVMNEISGV